MSVERRQRAVTRRKTCKRYFAKFNTPRLSHIPVRKTHVQHVHYTQSDEWRITISISSGNRCENFTKPGMDVPCNKGNYMPRELLARKTDRREFRDSFWYSATEFIMAAHRSHEHFPVPQAKFETLRHLRFSFAKKYSRSKFRFSLLRKQHGKSIFMRRKSDITLHRRNVSRLRSIQLFRILYSRLFTILA